MPVTSSSLLCRPGYGSSRSQIQAWAETTQRSPEAPQRLARSLLLSPEKHQEPSNWVCFTAKGSVTKLCGRRKEGINAPKAVRKSTLQSSCSLCYLILILIEVFSPFARGAWIPLCVLLPGQPATTCLHGPAAAATAGPAARSGCSEAGPRLRFTHRVRAPLRDILFNAISSSVKCLQIAKSLRDSKY